MTDEPFDFEAAMAAKVASLDAQEAAEETTTEPEEQTQDTPDEIVAAEPVDDDTDLAAEPADDEPDEVIEPEDEQLRDAQGRFMPKLKDDRAQRYLEQFGGDLDKAFAAAVEAQSLIGRQGSELGDLRKTVQELADRIEQRDEPRPQRIAGDFEELLDEDPHSAVVMALEAQDERAYHRAMEAWIDESPAQAFEFRLALERERMKNEFATMVQPATDSVAQQQVAQDINRARAELENKFTDIGEILSTATEAELEGFPANLARDLRDGDYEARRGALEAMYRWVKSARPATPQEQQQPTPDDTAAEEQRAQARSAKKDAVVASGSSAPSTEGKTDRERFKEYMLAPDDTSIAHGLTRE